MDEITSRKNPLCVHIKKLGTSRGYREEHREFLCDGVKMLEEAVKAGADIPAVLTASDLPPGLASDTRVYRAEREILDSLSPLKTAQDILFTCKMPEQTAFIKTAGIHILLDGIQDPGNVGTIIRTANAFGLKSVILTDGCADLYNPKTMRATMGAAFRQRVFYISDLLDLRGVNLIGAALGPDCRDISEVSLKDAVIAIGSEGRGLSKEVLLMCKERVTIPIAAECESLNAAVAASILMWEAGRRRGHASKLKVES